MWRSCKLSLYSHSYGIVTSATNQRLLGIKCGAKLHHGFLARDCFLIILKHLHLSESTQQKRRAVFKVLLDDSSIALMLHFQGSVVLIATFSWRNDDTIGTIAFLQYLPKSLTDLYQSVGDIWTQNLDFDTDLPTLHFIWYDKWDTRLKDHHKEISVSTLRHLDLLGWDKDFHWNLSQDYAV